MGATIRPSAGAWWPIWFKSVMPCCFKTRRFIFRREEGCKHLGDRANFSTISEGHDRSGRRGEAIMQSRGHKGTTSAGCREGCVGRPRGCLAEVVIGEEGRIGVNGLLGITDCEKLQGSQDIESTNVRNGEVDLRAGDLQGWAGKGGEIVTREVGVPEGDTGVVEARGNDSALVVETGEDQGSKDGEEEAPLITLLRKWKRRARGSRSVEGKLATNSSGKRGSSQDMEVEEVTELKELQQVDAIILATTTAGPDSQVRRLQ